MEVFRIPWYGTGKTLQVTNAFLSPTCPNIGLGLIFICASEGNDHRRCCTDLGVPSQ